MRQAALTRRGFVAAAAAGVAYLAAPRARAARLGGQTGAAQFLTEPSWSPPGLDLGVPAGRTAPGLVFVAPFGGSASSGPLILDNEGDPVWFLPTTASQAQDFRVQTYRGTKILTWFESSGGVYGGSWVLYDGGYQEIARVHAGHGYQGDLHEFLITARNTALVSIANQVAVDGAQVVEGVVQEIDIASGAVLFEWHSLDHVPLSDSYRTEVTSAGNIDYFHLNSIDVDTDDNLLVSSRHTSCVYKLDRKTGAIIWRLGGMRSDFSFDPEAVFAFQHDVRRQADGTLTVFDNGATDAGAGQVEAFSRGIRLAVDPVGRSVTLLREYVPEAPRLATAMGNMQVLPNGNVFVGWGTAGGFTEFTKDGDVVLDASFDDGSASYRAFRVPWAATPAAPPRVFLESENGALSAYASWNGATKVAYWEVTAGRGRRFVSQRTGFETVVGVPADAAVVTVAALDAKRRVLRKTPPIRL